MKILPEGKSRALSVSALAAGGICGLMAALNLSDLITLLRLSSTSAFFLFLSRAAVPAEMPPVAAFAVDHPVAVFALTSALWAAGCVLALGVWRRGEWARRGAAAMLYLLAAAAGLALLFPNLIIPRPLFYQGVSIAPEFNAVVKAAAFYLKSAAAAGGALCLWGALVLDRSSARLEFGPLRKEGENEKN